MQLEGTALSSMARDLIELYTKERRIDGEEDIAACTAATYSGGSSRFIFLRQLDSCYPPFRRFRHGKLWYAPFIFQDVLEFSFICRQSLQSYPSYWLLCYIQRCRHVGRKSLTVWSVVISFPRSMTDLSYLTSKVSLRRHWGESSRLKGIALILHIR